jgi:nucleoside-diphosphate-sugar epimerase
MNPDKPILVTGATGFIGSHLAERLISEGYAVRLLVRNIERLNIPLQMSTQVFLGDLEKPESLLAAVKDVDVIFHCAANVRTWDLERNYERVNVSGLNNLLSAVADSKTLPRRFVHLSTVDVYGFPRNPCDEECLPRPSGFGYGDSKLRAEHLLRVRAQTLGIPFVILRPCNVMGPRSPFIERIGHELRSGLMLTIHRGDVNAGFLYVKNLVDVILWAADAQQAVNETFNVNDLEGITWNRFLEDFHRGIRGKGWTVDLPYSVANIAASIIETTYRVTGLRQEPLLHRLLVRIFGRSCGHSSQKLIRAGAPVGSVPYEQAMRASIEWYLQSFPR